MELYPKFKYHREKAALIVADPTEEDALGAGWADSPAAFDVEPEASQEPEVDEAPEEGRSLTVAARKPARQKKAK